MTHCESYSFLGLTFAALAAEHSTLVDRVGTTGFVQLEAESFKTLSLQEQTLAYWLTQASIAIDPINYDQNSIWGLRQKALLEEILRHPQGVDSRRCIKSPISPSCSGPIAAITMR